MKCLVYVKFFKKIHPQICSVSGYLLDADSNDLKPPKLVKLGFSETFSLTPPLPQKKIKPTYLVLISQGFANSPVDSHWSV